MTSNQAIKSWLKQLNTDKDFIPLCNIIDEKQFKPMYLVVKVKNRFPRLDRISYQPTNIKLQDLLLSGEHAAELDESQLFPLQDEIHGKVQGSLSVDAQGGNFEVGAGVHISHKRHVTVKKRHISPEYLSFVDEDGKVNMGHRFIREWKRLKKNLHVITDVVETVKATCCEESNEIKGNFVSKLSGFFKLDIQGGQGRKRAIDIPKDCTVAYRVCKLYIGNGYLYISAPGDTSDVGTFGAEIMMCTTETGTPYKELVLPPQTRSYMEEITEGNYRESKTSQLQRELEGHCEKLFLLSARHCGQVLTGFVAIMRENDLLQQLKCQLEKALERVDQFRLKTDRLELQELVKNLQDSRGDLITSLAEPVLYFLQALDELTEVQLLLMAESVKKGILSKQLALVKSILDGGRNFTVDAQLESRFEEEDLNITGAMIESSGVTLQREGPTLVGTGDPDAFLSLNALYVGLCILERLYLGSKKDQPAQPSQPVHWHENTSSHILSYTGYSSDYEAWLRQRWPVHTSSLYSSTSGPGYLQGIRSWNPSRYSSPIWRSMQGSSTNLSDAFRRVSGEALQMGIWDLH